MTYLLDTNVISEPSRSRPDDGVVRWMRALAPGQAHLAAVVLAELLYGAEKHADPVKSRLLLESIEGARRQLFQNQVLAFDEAVARRYASLRVATRSRTRPLIDLQIAATALTHNLTLVTRNIADFEGLGLPLLNPWQPVVT